MHSILAGSGENYMHARWMRRWSVEILVSPKESAVGENSHFFWNKPDIIFIYRVYSTLLRQSILTPRSGVPCKEIRTSERQPRFSTAARVDQLSTSVFTCFAKGFFPARFLLASNGGRDREKMLIRWCESN